MSRSRPFNTTNVNDNAIETIVVQSKWLNPNKLNKESPSQFIKSNFNICKRNSLLKAHLTLFDQKTQLFQLKNLFYKCYDITNGDYARTKQMLDQMATKVVVKIECCRYPNIFTKLENNIDNSSVYEINKNLLNVHCKKKFQSNNTMAEDSDKIKNTIPPSLNVQQSNCINDDLIIEETESNTDDNINSAHLLSNQSEKDYKVVSVPHTGSFKKLINHRYKYESLNTGSCLNSLTKSSNDTNIELIDLTLSDNESDSNDMEVTNFNSDVTVNQCEKDDKNSFLNHITSQKNMNSSQNEANDCVKNVLNQLITSNELNASSECIYQQTEIQIQITENAENTENLKNKYSNKTNNSLQATNIEYSSDYEIHKLFKVIHYYSFKYIMLLDSEVVNKIIELLKKDDLISNINKMWHLPAVQKIQYLLKQLLMVLDEIKNGKHIVFMGCLIALFRKVIDTTVLSDNDLCSNFVIFTDVIKKCMLLLDKNFWTEWLPTGWSSYFYIGCIVVDKMLYGTCKSCKSLYNLVNWKKILNMNTLFNLTLYFLNCTTPNTKSILNDSNKSNTAIPSASVASNKSNDDFSVITTSALNSTTLSLLSNPSGNNASASEITSTLSMTSIIPVLNTNENNECITLIPVPKINESIDDASAIISTSKSVNISNMTVTSMSNNATFKRPQNNVACTKEKTKYDNSVATSSSTSNNETLSMWQNNHIPVKKRKILDSNSVLSCIPNTTTLSISTFPVPKSNESNYGVSEINSSMLGNILDMSNTSTLPKPKRKYTKRKIQNDNDTLPKPVTRTPRKYTKKNSKTTSTSNNKTLSKRQTKSVRVEKLKIFDCNNSALSNIPNIATLSSSQNNHELVNKIRKNNIPVNERLIPTSTTTYNTNPEYYDHTYYEV